MAIDLLLGLQWGDEGKGKIVDVLTPKYDIIARFQGGPNAGHTLEFEGIKHVLHTIPSGIFHPNVINVIGNGVVIDPIILKKEIEALTPFHINIKERLLISRKAHIILPTHRLLDKASELSKGKSKIGSTLKGIGPCYMDKTGRNGLRIGDLENADFPNLYHKLTQKHLAMIDFYGVTLDYNLKELEEEFFEAINLIKTLTFIDSEDFFYHAQKQGKKILAEGAQGSMLDIDFGTYPFVTSSNTTASGACTGLGIAPNQIKNVMGIFKAYTTRVGSGSFPTELFDETGDKIAQIGREVGATTGRKRRCGWLDLVALRYAIHLSGVTQLMMMKADVLNGFDSLKICTAYHYKGETIHHFPYGTETENIEPIYTELKGWHKDLSDIKNVHDLPNELMDYIRFIEKETEVPVTLVSVGADRKQTLLF
ncbi:adenylosuccinate synthase [Capnocytophaga sp. oral taxon 338]|uniref:adenylosuccinate synthase n=1 Tax=Capnocytophaga sp. oral taxon 338 TaxID=710239 RepID=UPI000202DBE7|nr:adenylosuccinate synthase [Capnocytophaga sp. oral taxon 338]EGD33380.1 adenylosuccinate synthase [Capnocytophaga sp. oral taxon 338 str. F0234]